MDYICFQKYTKIVATTLAKEPGMVSCVMSQTALIWHLY